MAVDGLDCLVLYGGYPAEYPYHPAHGTWVFDGFSWTQVDEAAPQGSRVGAGMARAPGGGVLLFGGASTGMGTTINRDTWRWGSPAGASSCPLVGRL